MPAALLLPALRLELIENFGQIGFFGRCRTCDVVFRHNLVLQLRCCECIGPQGCDRGCEGHAEYAECVHIRLHLNHAAFCGLAGGSARQPHDLFDHKHTFEWTQYIINQTPRLLFCLSGGGSSCRSLPTPQKTANQSGIVYGQPYGRNSLSSRE